MTQEDTPQQAFAIAAPGLEPIVARELQAMGMNGVAEPGGVAFEGTSVAIARANLWLRTASRVVLRVASFEARSFAELERKARRIDWAQHMPAGTAVRFRVTCRKSRLYHSDAVAQRLADAARRAGAVPADGAAPSDDDDATDTSTDAQLYVVRFLHDQCTISADTSGALLHRRGYRQAVTKAPLRETLAAALLLHAEYESSRALVDPMCGSGTIPIEAALIARRMAPGRNRKFAFERWPSFDKTAWRALREQADEVVIKRAGAPIVGSDRDDGAIAAAVANAERAGVAADIEFTRRTVSEVVAPADVTEGLIATNPPYGVRVGESAPLRDLYARLGDVARKEFAGWRLAIISADQKLEAQLRLPFGEPIRTTNGGIPIRLLVARV